MVFPKRRLKTTSTQCTRKRKPTAGGGGNTINTNATTEVPAAAGVHTAAAAAAGVHTAATAAAGVHTTAAAGILTAATAADHAAADHAAAAADHAAAAAAAITATVGGLCFQTSLYCNYIGPHILWQDTFLQSYFAALSDDDMASSREDPVALQTLATAV